MQTISLKIESVNASIEAYNNLIQTQTEILIGVKQSDSTNTKAIEYYEKSIIELRRYVEKLNKALELLDEQLDTFRNLNKTYNNKMNIILNS